MIRVLSQPTSGQVTSISPSCGVGIGPAKCRAVLIVSLIEAVFPDLGTLRPQWEAWSEEQLAARDPERQPMAFV